MNPVSKLLPLMLMMITSSFCLVFSHQAYSTDDIHQFDNPSQKSLYLELVDQLRCPKCQNQNIADSDANVAKDLRAKVHKLVMQGKSKTEVVDFMVERYGYFVYYKPPVTPGTLVLWLLPIGFMLSTVLFIWFKAKRSQVNFATEHWNDEQEQKLNSLIERVESSQLFAPLPTEKEISTDDVTAKPTTEHKA